MTKLVNFFESKKVLKKNECLRLFCAAIQYFCSVILFVITTYRTDAQTSEGMIPAEAYDYSQTEIEGKFTDDWTYVISGYDGNPFTRFGNIFVRDFTAPANRSTVYSAGIDAIPIAGLGVFKVLKGAKYMGEIGDKYLRFEKVIQSTNLKGQARAVYVQIFNKEGRLIKMYKDTYRIDGRFLHRRLLKPSESNIYRK